MPPHLLHLKVGTPVILLRNLDPPRLCNGTCIYLTRVGKRVLSGTIMGGTHAGEQVLLPRIFLTSKDNDPHQPCQFICLQFPVKLAFAIMVNKSQRQSLTYVGVDLQSYECFGHGQLYVALTRVTSKQNLCLLDPSTNEFWIDKMVKNVVHKQVLLTE